MDIMALFEKAFSLGFNISLAEVLTSKEYVQILEHQQGFSRQFPESSDEGIALRAGIGEMAVVLNTHNEHTPWCLPQNFANDQLPNFELMALIRFFGIKIIASAKDCLPQRALELAEQWKSAMSSDEQIKIAKEVALLFQGPDLEEHKSLIELPPGRTIDLKEYPCNYIPRIYGRFEPGVTDICCVGKALLLAAFAELTSSRFVAVFPIVSVECAIQQYIHEMCDVVAQEIMAGAFPVSKSLSDMILQLCKVDIQDDFHVAIAIQLKNSELCLIDPNLRLASSYRLTGELGKALTALNKYHEVLPGLTIHVNDGAFCEKIDVQKECIQEQIEFTKRLQECCLGWNDSNPETLILLINDFSEFVLVKKQYADELRHTGHEDKSKEVESLNTADFIRDIILSGDLDGVKEVIHEQGTRAIISHVVGFILERALNAALNRVFGEDNRRKMVHPHLELGNPVFSLAIAVLSKIATYMDVDENALLFAGFTRSQLMLRNVLVYLASKEARDAYEEEMLCETVIALQGLPLIHPECKKLIDLMSQPM
ncbi:hypothetical protein KKH43_06705 [Patescibacteria group bacterium]|nr:hypothetical protein [Patescibacteria group bacterium]